MKPEPTAFPRSSYVCVARSVLPVLDGTELDLMVWSRPNGEDETVVLQRTGTHAGPTSGRSGTGVATVRLHSACMTGDVFGSLRCDCGLQLEEAVRVVAAADWGILIYPLAHEGRGIGLANKIRAYAHQDEGLDSFEANDAIGFDADCRDYTGAVAILRTLGVERVRLLTRNPQKVRAFEHGGLTVVSTTPLDVAQNRFNTGYIETKLGWFNEQAAAACSGISVGTR